MIEAIDGFKQYDSRACGPVAIVAHRVAGLDPDDRARISRDLLIEATEATVGALSGPRDRAGRWQVPWPRMFGTSPWAAAREMSVGSPTSYAWRALDPSQLDAEFDRLATTVESDRVLLYVGDRWLPRHIVTVVGRRDDQLIAFDPATGGPAQVTREAFIGRQLNVSGWSRPWLVVEPDRRVEP